MRIQCCISQCDATAEATEVKGDDGSIDHVELPTGWVGGPLGEVYCPDYLREVAELKAGQRTTIRRAMANRSPDLSGHWAAPGQS
jgi:hypothetical protein